MRNANLTKLRISVVQYWNTAPLVWGFVRGPLHGKYDLSFTVPSQCAETLRNGAADIAIIPSIEYQRIKDLVILPDLAIASKKRVRSLLVIAKKPMEEIKTIALDRSSRSTQALTKILCAQHWHISPEYRETEPDLAAMLQSADAALLIGDPAFRLAITAEPFAKKGPQGQQICPAKSLSIPTAESLHIYDIVEEWRRLTSLPAVLAVWAARPEVIDEGLMEDFHASRDFGLRHLPEICREAAEELALPAEQLRQYLTENIDFSLDSENLEGLAHYYTVATEMNLIQQSGPITIASTHNIPGQYMDLSFAKPG